MASYYVNMRAQKNGAHEVHRSDCEYLPSPQNRMYLGEFPNCLDAVKKAKEVYPEADGCATCSPKCHAS